MEVRVFELAGGKLSVRELIWNEEVKAHFRIINDKIGRSEVTEFQVSTKQRFNRPSALEELINHLKSIQKRADTRQPTDAEAEGTPPSRPPDSYNSGSHHQAFPSRARQQYTSRGSYPSRNFLRERSSPPPAEASELGDNADEPNFNQ